MRKKAVIGATMTWIVATLIIVFLMLIFLAGIAGIKAQRFNLKAWLFGEKGEAGTSYATEHLINFLNMPIADKNIYDFISNIDLSDKQGKENYKVLAEDFMNKQFPVSVDDLYEKTWLRIYDKDDEVDLYYSGKFYDYEIRHRYHGTKRVSTCDPEDKSTILIKIFIKPDKKIVLCRKYN